MQTPADMNGGSGANFGLIPARGGSQGLPGKNLRPLAGRPLIAHSIESAMASGVFEQVHVSTEDMEISEVAVALGATVITRPGELAQAETPMAPVVEHAVDWYERQHGSQPRHIFLLQPTSPLRSADDIQAAASLLTAGEWDSVMGVFEADDPPQWALLADSNGLLRPAADWDRYLSRRQDLPPTYLDGPLYAIETDAFRAWRRFLTDRTRLIAVPRHRAIDIDTEMDFLFAEFLLERGLDLDAPTHAPR